MMPQQRPHRSFQNYETPWSFLDAVEARFGAISIDLAANERTVRGRTGPPRWFGPGGLVENSLSEAARWDQEAGQLWLNPPFAEIEPWVRKCAETPCGGATGRRILLLVPASVGSNWFATHVDGAARVLFVRPRLSFDGRAPFPKDCMLAVYGEDPGYECWSWVPQRTRSAQERRPVDPVRSAAARLAAFHRRDREQRIEQSIPPHLIAIWRKRRKNFDTVERFLEWAEMEHEEVDREIAGAAEDEVERQIGAYLARRDA